MIGPHCLPCDRPKAQAPDRVSAGATKWVLPATVLGSSLGFIDGSVVNVGLPVIQQAFDASFAAVQWVINGYMLAFAALILLGGAAADRFGRRRVFLAGLAGFVTASAGCGLSPSAEWLVILRFLQGAAAALLAPASLAIISAGYAGEARGKAIGTWAAAGALTTALGPPLGGWLVDAVGWRAIFFVNLPVGTAALALAVRLPHDPGSLEDGPLDLAGAALAVLSLGSISYGLIAFGEGQVSPGAVAIGAAVPAAVAFVSRERRAHAPMLPLALFSNSSFSGANALTVFLYAALSGALFLLPFLLIRTHGYSAAAAGAAFLPFSAIMGLGSRWSGALVEKTGSRPPLLVGTAVTSGGFLILGISGQGSYWSAFLPGLIVVGIGMTLCVAPLTTTVFDSAPERSSGAASGINNAAARTGGLIAVAALGLFFGGVEAESVEPSTLTDAYRLVMITAAALAAVSTSITALTIHPRRDAKAADEPRRQ